MVSKEPEDLRPLAAAVEYVMTVDPPLKEYSKTSPAHFVRIIERMVEYNEKQLQLARLDAKIEELEYSKVEIGNIPDELWRFNGELLGKWGERKLRLSKLDDRIDKLTAQKAHLTTKGGAIMSEQQLRDALFQVWRDGRDGNGRYVSVDEAEKLIDQYAYEYAERVIGNNPAPIVCSCDAPAVAMCICTAKFGNDLRAAQRKLNKKLSSHKEEERKI